MKIVNLNLIAMRHALICVLSLFVYGIAYGQTFTESFVACGKSYTAICEQKEGNSIKVTIKDGMDDSINSGFTVSTDDLDVFASAFKRAFMALRTPPDTDCNAGEQSRVQAYARNLFIHFKASLDTGSFDLQAATFRVKDSLYVYAKTCDTCRYHRSANKYRILMVKVEINQGYIENIKAYVSINGKTFYYTNNYGIGISSKTNFDNFSNIKLFEIYSSPYSRDTGRIHYYIMLNNLIDYDFDLAVDRRDYSPKNISFTLNGGESIKLFKEETKKLFEAHIFTDFIGLSDNKPNGLVQTEVSKKINLNTVQFQSGRLLYKAFKSYGFLQYVEPIVSISKLEQHNKHLILGDLDSIRLNPGATDTSTFSHRKHRYATPLDLYQYQSFSGGLNANILFLSNHDLKYTFFLNAGARLGITQVRDSGTTINNGVITKTGLSSEYSVNTLQFYPEAIINFLPEERFSLSLSQRFVYMGVFSSAVQSVTFDKNDPAKVYAKGHQWLTISELLVTIQVNDNSKLFGRLRFNGELSNLQNNFAQVQVGYSVYILGNSKK